MSLEDKVSSIILKDDYWQSHQRRVEIVDEILSACEEYIGKEIIGEPETVGLPVTEVQEMNNYNKKQRNKLRAEQRKRLQETLRRKA